MDEPERAEAGDREGGVRTYTVMPGDTLSRIAERFYGNAAEWRRIYEANQEKLPNPDILSPGLTLWVP